MYLNFHFKLSVSNMAIVFFDYDICTELERNFSLALWIYGITFKIIVSVLLTILCIHTSLHHNYY